MRSACRRASARSRTGRCSISASSPRSRPTPGACSSTARSKAPTTWKWGEFTDLPKTTLTTDIHCVTAWSRYDNKWEGVSARDLLKLVKPKAAAQHVIFHSYDTYTTNVPLADFSADDVMLAWSWNGEAISREHGGPLRVVIPKLYFWKSAKWIKRIEFSVHDKPGFWEVRGYHNYGDPWLEQRYDEEALTWHRHTTSPSPPSTTSRST